MFLKTVCVVFLTGFLRDVRVSGCVFNCTDKPEFDPSRLVVKYEDPAFATCSACKTGCKEELFNLEKALGNVQKNGTKISWTVDSMTEWDTSVLCYYTDDTGRQCCSELPVTVYNPPDHVSISFKDHSGPMVEGQQSTLQCEVHNVAPAENLTVTFYKGQTPLGQKRSNDTDKYPVNETFSLSITASKEDDGVQYWCEAKLELGPEGPQHPPMLMSEKITNTVHYKPQRQGPPTEQITVTEGDRLYLNCSAVGNPSPLYSWDVPSTSLLRSNSEVLATDSADLKDAGQYTCHVSNLVETIQVNFHVVVNADNTLYYIIGTVLAVVVVLAILALVFIPYYRQHRMGQYKLKDVFRLHTQHVALPTAEQI